MKSMLQIHSKYLTFTQYNNISSKFFVNLYLEKIQSPEERLQRKALYKDFIRLTGIV